MENVETMELTNKETVKLGEDVRDLIEKKIKNETARANSVDSAIDALGVALKLLYPKHDFHIEIWEEATATGLHHIKPARTGKNT